MTGYYKDSEKITFDRAEQLVDQYIREYEGRKSRVTCKHVADHFDIQQSHHNLIRLNEALDDRLEITREAGSKATQFRIP